MQVPAPTGVTVDPETVQTPALDGSAEKTTGSPEVAVAATLYDETPATAPAGGVDVKLIVCRIRPTENVCCTSGAV